MKALAAAVALGAMAVSLLSAPGPAQADSGIEIREAWSRASAGMARAGAGFMQITNHGATDDRLIAASAPVSPVTELHTHIRDGDIMRMREVDAIDLPAGQSVTLQPGGLHIMFINLHDRLSEGQTFDVTLEFEHAPPQVVPVTVMGVGAMGVEGSGHHHGHHGHGR